MSKEKVLHFWAAARCTFQPAFTTGPNGGLMSGQWRQGGKATVIQGICAAGKAVADHPICGSERVVDLPDPQEALERNAA